MATRTGTNCLLVIHSNIAKCSHHVARFAAPGRCGMGSRLADGDGTIMAISATLRCAFEAAANVAGGTVGARMRADQGKAGAAVIKATIAASSIRGSGGSNCKNSGKNRRHPT